MPMHLKEFGGDHLVQDTTISYKIGKQRQTRGDKRQVESKTMGFNHLSAKALMTRLCNVGGSLDHMDVTELITNIQKL